MQDPGKAASGSLTVPTGAGDHEGACAMAVATGGGEKEVQDRCGTAGEATALPTGWAKNGGEKDAEGLNTPGERMPVAVGTGLGLDPRGGCTAQAGAAAGTA